MSLVWIEGFDHEANSTDLQNGIVIPGLGPGASGFGIAIANTNTRWDVGSYASVTNAPGAFTPNYYGFVVPFGSTQYSEGYYGSALSLTQGTTARFSFFDIANGIEQLIFTISSFGAYSFLQGGNSTPLFSGFVPGFSVNWNYIELFANINTTSGAFALKVNGAPITTQTGLNTASTVNIYNQSITPSFTFTGMGCAILNNNSGTAGFDDMYFNDTTGSAPYNTFLGDVRILTSKANGAGTYTQFAALSGQNWQEVSEAVVDGDGSYNYSNTVGAIDTFTTTGGVINSTIFGVQVTTYARKDDAINRQLSNYVISSSTAVASAPVYMTSSYIYNKSIFAADPHTSSPWTSSAVNALEIGYKLIS